MPKQCYEVRPESRASSDVGAFTRLCAGCKRCLHISQFRRGFNNSASKFCKECEAKKKSEAPRHG